MTTDTATWVGALLAGRYQVTAKLGEGGMGFVYRATDRRLNTDVVVKVPRRALMEDREFAKRFAREIQSLVQLAHPHVVKVMDVGEHDGLPFAVMQCLAGGSLQDRQIRNGRPVPMHPHDLVPWLKDVAAALDFLHGQGYVHRDIKPGNILFDAHGNSYLGDFGIAKALADREQSKRTEALTGSGMVLGTPEYMAPELIMGQPYDGRVDQYALAITVYELLSAQGPFAGPNSAAVFVKQTTVQPRPLHEVAPSVPQAISDALQTALSKDPKQRFPNCAAFALNVLKAARAAPAAPATEAAIVVACPACTKKSRIPAGAAGKRVKCPSCQTAFEVPAGVATKAPVAATMREASPPRPAVAATVREATTAPVAATVRESVLPPTAPAQPIAATVRESVPSDTAPPAGAASPAPAPPAAKRRPLWLMATGGGVVAVLLLVGLFAAFGAFARKSDKTSRSESDKTSPGEPASAKLPKEFTNSMGMKFVLIPAGKFLMGASASEIGWGADEGPQHEVEISSPFYLCVHLVTQEQFESLMGSNPAHFSPRGQGNLAVQGLDTGRLPVDNVLFGEAMAFCQKLSARPEEKGRAYRLPNEAEWEYACRAGTTTRFAFGDTISTTQANFLSGDGIVRNVRRPTPVGSYPANAWGLFDMHGNLWEWCADSYDPDYYARSPKVNPLNDKPSADDKRVLRGGSFSADMDLCRSAKRYASPGGNKVRFSAVGFRVACTVSK
jgi:formylglycine-generating enzyme required for sulfatase activity